jgi:hypothetical protein
MKEIGLNKTKLEFVWEFREKPMQDAKRIPFSELSIGELLYRVLAGEGEWPRQEA